MNLQLRNQIISADWERELNMLCMNKWYDNLQLLGSMNIHRRKKSVSAIVCSTLLTQRIQTALASSGTWWSISKNHHFNPSFSVSPHILAHIKGFCHRCLSQISQVPQPVPLAPTRQSHCLAPLAYPGPHRSAECWFKLALLKLFFFRKYIIRLSVAQNCCHLDSFHCVLGSEKFTWHPPKAQLFLWSITK